MKPTSTSANVLVVLWISVFAAAPGFAVPTLQLDIVGGIYDEATETVVGPSGDVITLVALLTPKGRDDFSDLDGTYYISAALLPPVEEPGADLGSFTFMIEPELDSYTVDVTDDMFFGVPPLESVLEFDAKDLSKHGVFETYFSEFSFTFDEKQKAAKYNVQETPGGFDASGTGSFYRTFTVNTSLLAEGFNLHFDLYNTDLVTEIVSFKGSSSIVDIDRDLFAPFSHDAETNTNGKDLPEPMTLLLLGTGLTAIAVVRRRKESR